MGPSRKRPRTNAPKDDSASTTTPQIAADELKNRAASIPLPETPTNGSSSDLLDKAPTPLRDTKPEDDKKVNTKSSWYGTWPRKSTASTQIARETILADKTVGSQTSPDLLRYEQSKQTASPNRPASMCLGKGKETLDVTMGGTFESDNTQSSRAKTTKKTSQEDGDVKSTPGEMKTTQTIPAIDGMKDIPRKEQGQIPQPVEESPAGKDVPQRPATSSGWLGGWLGRSVDPASDTIHQSVGAIKADEPAVKEPEISEDIPDALVPPTEVSKPIEHSSNTTSWFGLWSKAAPSNVEKPVEEQMPVIASAPERDVVMEDTQLPAVTRPAAGSSWAFWSTENKQSSEPTIKPDDTRGELAIAGKPSETKPEPAKTTVIKDDKRLKPGKRGRPQSVEVNEAARKVADSDTIAPKGAPSQSPASGKVHPPNLLIPSVKSTYRLVENPSILQQIARLLLKSKQSPVKHVFLAKDTPKIKHALAIGIHGLFPAPLLRTVIGQPTGTSIKFANHAAEAIRRWTDSRGSTDCEIEKVALEGEGKISDRVDNLWKLLLNWIDHIRKADFILIGCHSQGVPVAVMLVAKLIEFGVVASAKIGICAMAGVSLGPFSDYKSRLFSGSAGELFDFANPGSTVSKRYEDSLKIVLKYGAKITYCGSIDDQLVSMESSIFSTVSHPYIFRAVFVDGRIHAPDFLSHLVGFALKLRNLGVSDHGLIRELSAPLAGSLYTGEGHSRLYDDGKVYDLATEFALGTTSVGDVPLQIKKYEIPSNANPYVLPWIMRGLLEEDFVKTELDAETTELLKQFDDWKPTTKVLKDVKYRLEAVRSKL